MVKIMHLILCVFYHNKERDHKRTSALMSCPESLPSPTSKFSWTFLSSPRGCSLLPWGVCQSPLPGPGWLHRAICPCPGLAQLHLALWGIWEGEGAGVCTDSISSTPCRRDRHESCRLQGPQPVGFPSGLSTAYFSRKLGMAQEWGWGPAQ